MPTSRQAAGSADRVAATANASAIPRTFSRLTATTFQPPY